MGIGAAALALLKIGTRQVEGKQVRRLVESPDGRDNLRQNESAVVGAARTLSRQRIVRQGLNTQADKVGQSVGEGQSIGVRGRLLSASQHGVIVIYLQFAAAC